MSNAIIADYAIEANLEMLKKENSNMSQYEEFLVDVDDNIENLPFGNYGNELESLDLVDHLNFNSQGNLVVLTPPDMEETCDVATVDSSTAVTSPVTPIGPPARTVFSGGLNFRVEINGADTNRRKYLYSHQLNRIYVDIKADFPVQFHWDFARSGPMFVRATTVFSDEAQAEKRVERCLQHTHEVANADVDPVIVKNVLHSSREVGTRGAPGARDVYYCGRPERPDSWYSVVLACDGRTTEPYSHAYKFVCKNSCPGGINRRAIDIIFTLEDHTGAIHGRQTVGARVCACPRRDKLKDEESDVRERPGKRRAPPAPAPSNPLAPTPERRVKLEGDNGVLTLPPLPVVGLKTMTIGLEVMLNVMEQMAATQTHNQHALQIYQQSINMFRSKIEELKSTPQGDED